MTAFEDFVNLELPRRSVYLNLANTGYDGDPNDGGAPAIVSGAPLGSWFRENTAKKTWRVAEGSVWEEQGTGVNSDLGLVGRVLIEWFVRNGGDDNNDGLTAGTAFATIQKALSMLAPNAEGLARQKIEVTGFIGSGADVLYWDFPSSAKRGEFDGTRDTSAAKQDYWDFPFEIYADPAFVRNITITGSVQDPVTNIAEVTVSDVLVVNELKGKRIWVSLFFHGTVLSNTANQIILASYSGAAFSNGLTGVYEPSCTLDFGDSAVAFSGTRLKSNSTLSLNGIKFDSTISGSGAALEVTPDGNVTFTWCDFVGGLVLSPGGKNVTMFDCYLVGGGFTHNSPYNIRGCVFDGVVLNVSGSVGAGSNTIFGCLFDACSPIAGGNFEQNTDLVITNCWITNATSNGIHKNHPFNGRFNSNRIDNSVGSAIAVTTAGGIQKIRDTVGVGNGQYGCSIGFGAIVQYQNTVGVNTVTGTLGEVKIGERVLDWADCPNHDIDAQFTQLCSVVNGPDIKQSPARFQYIYKVNSADTGPIVYNDWEDLWRQVEYTRSLNGSNVAIDIAVDLSLNPFPAFSDVPVSVEFPLYDFENITLTSVDGQIAELRFLDGTDAINIRRIKSLGIYDANLTTPLEVLPAAPDFSIVYLEENSSIQSIDGGAGFYDVSAVGLAGMRFEVTGLSVLAFDIPGHGYKNGQLLVNGPAGFFLQLVGYDLNTSQRTFSDHTRATFDLAVGSFAIIVVEDAAALPSSLGTAFLGTQFPPIINQAASLAPNPFQLPPATAPVSASFRQMIRLDASAGPITQTLPGIFNEELPNSGGMLVVSEYGGGTVTLDTPANNTLNKGVKAIGSLSVGAIPLNNETVVLSKTYTFQTVLTNIDGNVLIGASASDSIDNLVAAITLGAGAGVAYAALTTTNPDATAAAGVGDTMDATALAGGLNGNAIATTETLSDGGSSWASATLLGGLNGTITVPPLGGLILETDGISDWAAVGIFNPQQGPGAVYVYQPGGGGIGPVVFEDWKTLETAKEANRALAGGDYPIEVRIDDSITTPAVIPANGADPAYNLTEVTLSGKAQLGAFGAATRLDFADNTSVIGLRTIKNNLGIVSLNTTTVLDDSGSGSFFIQIDNNCFVNTRADTGVHVWGNSGMIAGDFAILQLGKGCFINFNFGGGFANGPVFDLPTAGSFMALVSREGAAAPFNGLTGVVGTSLFVSSASARDIPNVFNGFLGTIALPSSPGIPASLSPNPYYIAAPLTAAVGNPRPGQWLRFDTTGGAIAQEIPGVSAFNNNYKQPGVFFAITHELGADPLTIFPPGADTLNGGTDPITVPVGGTLWLMNNGIDDTIVSSSHDPSALAANSLAVIFRDGSPLNGPTVFGTHAGAMARIAELRAASQGAGVFELQLDASVTSPLRIPKLPDTPPVAPTAALTGPVLGPGALIDRMTLTDVGATFVVGDLGRYIIITGFATPANNGTFPITAQTATTVEYVNAAGVAEAVGAGMYSLTVQHDMTNTTFGAVGVPTIRVDAGTTFKGLRRFKGGGFMGFETPAGGPSAVADFGGSTFDSVFVEDGWAIHSEVSGAPPIVNTIAGAASMFFIAEMRVKANVAQNPGGGSPVFHIGLAGQFGIGYVIAQSRLWRNGWSSVVGATSFWVIDKGNIFGVQQNSLGTNTESINSSGPDQNVRPAGDVPAATAPINAFSHDFDYMRFDVSGGGFTQVLPQLPQANSSKGTGGEVTISEESGTAGLLIQGSIAGAPDDTINGSLDLFPCPAGGSVKLVNDGESNWKVVAIYDPALAPLEVPSVVVRERIDGATVTIYIDPIAGDDTSDGLTPGTALATLPGMRAKFPQVLSDRSSRIVNFINATAAVITILDDALEIGSTSHLTNNYSYRGPAMIAFTAITTGPTTAALDVVPAVQVDQSAAPSGVGNRTRLNFTVATPGWTANDFRGAFLRVTRGGPTQVFYELPITENGTDFLIVDTLGIVGVLLATDTVEIVEPAIRIGPLPGEFVLGMVQNSAHTSFGTFVPGPIGATFERLTFRDMFVVNVYGLQFDRCILSDTFGGGNIFLDGTTTFKNTLSHWIVAFFCHSGNTVSSRNDDVPIDAAPETGLVVFNGYLQVGGAKAAFWGAAGRGNFVSSEPVSVYSGRGIIVSGNGSNFAIDGASLNGVNDAGEFGITALDGALCQIPGGDLVTITGGGGDLKVGAGAAISYGTGVGAFEEVAGYAGNFTRRLEGTAAAPAGDASVITTSAIV